MPAIRGNRVGFVAVLSAFYPIFPFGEKLQVKADVAFMAVVEYAYILFVVTSMGDGDIAVWRASEEAGVAPCSLHLAHVAHEVLARLSVHVIGIVAEA